MGSDIYQLKDSTALYDVLEIHPDATEKEIRRAYHRLAMIYHPDKNPDGEIVFKEICFAYNILSDPEKRIMYDNQTLRSNLLSRAKKEYTPEMDPNVELSPEDLRRFVEKLQREQERKEKSVIKLERRREEEMQRRTQTVLNSGDYRTDPDPRASFESLSNVCTDGHTTEQCALIPSFGPPPRTTAELLSDAVNTDRRIFAKSKLSTNPSSCNTARPPLCPAKLEMMTDYFRKRCANKGTSAAKGGHIVNANSTNQDLVPGGTSQRQSSVYSNFNFIEYMMNPPRDKSLIDKVILSEALKGYDGFS